MIFINYNFHLVTSKNNVYLLNMTNQKLPRTAKFMIGELVRHRHYPFRGVIFDVDPVFDNTDEWYDSIPEDIRPSKNQPFYHLLAENADTEYVAYVSEQNLVSDVNADPIDHPQISEFFTEFKDGYYLPRLDNAH